MDVALIIQQTDEELKVTRKSEVGDQQREIQQSFALDGGEHSMPSPLGRGEMLVKTSVKKDKLTNEGKQTVQMGGREIKMSYKEEFALSKDGQTLTVKTRRQMPMGTINSKWVYHKQ